MSGPPAGNADVGSQRAQADREAARRRVADLGDLVPMRGGDEAGGGWGDHDPEPDEDLLRDVPPHHG